MASAAGSSAPAAGTALPYVPRGRELCPSVNFAVKVRLSHVKPRGVMNKCPEDPSADFAHTRQRAPQNSAEAPLTSDFQLAPQSLLAGQRGHELVRDRGEPFRLLVLGRVACRLGGRPVTIQEMVGLLQYGCYRVDERLELLTGPVLSEGLAH